MTAAINQMKNDFSEFVLFSEEENRALDERCFERNMRGKPVVYTTCLVRNNPGTEFKKGGSSVTKRISPNSGKNADDHWLRLPWRTER
jgi:hypothetical protein